MSWIDSFTGIAGFVLTKAIVALIILLIGFIIGKICSRLTQKFLHEAELDVILCKAGARLSLEDSIAKLVQYIINFIAILIAVDQLGLTMAVLYILAAAMLVVVIVAVLLAIKDIIPNLVAGLFLLKRANIAVGDFVKIDRFEGKIERMDLFETRVKCPKSDIIYVPNAVMTRAIVLKKSKSQK